MVREPVFQAMSDAVLQIAAELSFEPVLHKLVRAAHDLAGARYAAIGVPDGAGGFSHFITTGMSDEQVAAIGPLPRTHGLLGAMLAETRPYATPDIKTDSRFWGWPSAHPDMRSFLGVPIVAQGDVVGAFYLTDKIGADEFSDADRDLITLLAAHAAIAIDHARLFERSREASVLAERDRLARELHDAMTQTLFSLDLAAESAANLVTADPQAAVEQVRTVQELARTTMAELRALIDDLRPAELEADGLVETLRKHVELIQRAHGVDVRLDVDSPRRLPSDVERAIARIVTEALHNALRHAGAGRIDVVLGLRGPMVQARVSDDGVGFDPDARIVRARRLGLTSMRERARSVGGELEITSTPGKGTTVTVMVPDA